MQRCDTTIKRAKAKQDHLKIRLKLAYQTIVTNNRRTQLRLSGLRQQIETDMRRTPIERIDSKNYGPHMDILYEYQDAVKELVGVDDAAKRMIEDHHAYITNTIVPEIEWIEEQIC